MLIKTYVGGPLSVNCYLVIDEETKKAFVVDPGGENQPLHQYVAENGLTVEAILLTHGHPDHICGIERFRKTYPDAILVAHQDEESLLGSAEQNHSKMYCGKDITLQADRWVSDHDGIEVGGLSPVFLHTPGHTPGGMCIYVKDCLFSGDTLFRNSIGRTDFPYGSFPELKKSIHSKLFALPNHTVVYPGHEGTTTIGHEKESNPFV